jgi:hypothetical protein
MGAREEGKEKRFLAWTGTTAEEGALSLFSKPTKKFMKWKEQRGDAKSVELRGGKVVKSHVVWETFGFFGILPVWFSLGLCPSVEPPDQVRIS